MIKYVLSCLNPFKLYRKAVKASFKIPIIANKLKAELAKSKSDFVKSYPK
jgi:hypothetical protein